MKSVKRTVFLFIFLNQVLLLGLSDPLIDPVVYQNKYGYYYVPLNQDHRPAVQKIKKGEVYEEKTLEFIEKIYRPGTSIVHAGAYFGDMLPFFSQLVGDKNRVWAFEPIKLNFACAQANIELNRIDNVILQNNALSSENTWLIMKVSDPLGKPYGGGCSVINHHNTLENIERVQSLLLDEILPNEDPIGIIHLDVEGHEIEALRGAIKIIEKNHPILILEVWNQKKREIEEFLEALNYKAVKEVDGNIVFIY